MKNYSQLFHRITHGYIPAVIHVLPPGKVLRTTGKLVILAVVLLASTLSSPGTSLVEDTFSSAPGNLVGTTPAVGGVWTAVNGATDKIQVTAGSLTAPAGLLASVGNKVTWSGSGEDASVSFTSQNSGTVYYAVLLNLAPVPNTTGVNLISVGSSTTALAASLAIRRDTVDTTKYNVGFFSRQTANGPLFSSVQLATNATHFVVISYTFVAGTGNDIIKLWLDPSSASFGGTEPTPTLTLTNASGDITSLNQLYLWQRDSATPNLSMDELVVATTWAEVTPPDGDNIYVNASAAPGGDGSAATPFNTISSAMASLTPGARMLIAPGSYREVVNVTAQGTAAQPITLQAQDPANPPFITGADAISGWLPVAGSGLPEASHPNAANLYYKDLTWQPDDLYADARRQTKAREPNSGWWPATTTDGLTISSSAFAGISGLNVTGTKMYFARVKQVSQFTKTVTGWSGTPGTAVTLDSAIGAPYTADGDHFYLYGTIALLNSPGEWVTQVNGSTKRLFWWPQNVADLSKTEGSIRTQLVKLGTASYVTLKNLNICHAAYAANGYGIGAPNTSVDPAGIQRTGIVIDHCSIYQNARFGCTFGGFKNLVMRHTLVTDGGYGVGVSYSQGTLLEKNEIAWNFNDGVIVSYYSDGTLLSKNVIHHHSRFAHPDNFQTHSFVTNTSVEDCLMVSGGQSAHNQQSTNLAFRRNMVVGSSAGGIFATAGGFTADHNTFLSCSATTVPYITSGCTLTGNIVDIRNSKAGFSSPGDYTGVSMSDNLYYRPFGGDAVVFTINGVYTRYNTTAALAAVGLDNGSIFADPGFTSAPIAGSSIRSDRIAQCTTTQIIVTSGQGSRFNVNDHIEIDQDGLDRVITAKTGDTLTFSPALSENPVNSSVVMNWGTSPVSDIDLRTAGTRGSGIIYEAYMRGDFDNDGIRDVAPWPNGIVSPRAP